jgi:hypothetical protein
VHQPFDDERLRLIRSGAIDFSFRIRPVTLEGRFARAEIHAYFVRNGAIARPLAHAGVSAC